MLGVREQKFVEIGNFHDTLYDNFSMIQYQQLFLHLTSFYVFRHILSKEWHYVAVLYWQENSRGMDLQKFYVTYVCILLNYQNTSLLDRQKWVKIFVIFYHLFISDTQGDDLKLGLLLCLKNEELLRSVAQGCKIWWSCRETLYNHWHNPKQQSNKPWL